jgi:uncharacterized protein with gpF-like domain
MHAETNLRIDFANAIRDGFERRMRIGRARPQPSRRGEGGAGQEHEQEKRSTMKSAYELAMERLEKASPSHSLTEDQKKEIAEVDSVYRAKIAEKEVFLKDQIRKAQSAGNSGEAQSLEKQLTSEIRRLQEECEAKKEKLRAGFTK